MGNTAISADGRFFSALLAKDADRKQSRVSIVDVVAGKEVSSIVLVDQLQTVIDLVAC